MVQCVYSQVMEVKDQDNNPVCASVESSIVILIERNKIFVSWYLFLSHSKSFAIDSKEVSL
jgi:hypothetical protein